MTSSDETQKVAELLDGERFAMLTTSDADGKLHSRPMAMQEVEFDGDLWFFATTESRKVEHIAANPQVNVTVSSNDVWVSLTGHATTTQDDAQKRELWNAGVEAWFPNGPEADDVLLIRIEAESAEYWDSPGGRVATVFSLAKAKVTGKPYSGGDNERVAL